METVTIVELVSVSMSDMEAELVTVTEFVEAVKAYYARRVTYDRQVRYGATMISAPMTPACHHWVVVTPLRRHRDVTGSSSMCRYDVSILR